MEGKVEALPLPNNGVLFLRLALRVRLGVHIADLVREPSLPKVIADGDAANRKDLIAMTVPQVMHKGPRAARHPFFFLRKKKKDREFANLAGKKKKKKKW